MISEILKKYIDANKKQPDENFKNFVKSGVEMPLVYQNGKIKISRSMANGS